MVGHGAPVFHCPSPAASIVPPIADNRSSSRSGNGGRSASKATSPDTAPPHLDDDESYMKFRNFVIAIFMFTISVIVASNFWPDWQDLLVVAIMFSYWAAILLLLPNHWDKAEEEQLQELIMPPPWDQRIAVQTMVVLTVVMVIAMALIVSISPSKRIDTAMIVFVSLVFAALGLVIRISLDHDHEKRREQKVASAGSEGIMPADLV